MSRKGGPRRPTRCPVGSAFWMSWHGTLGPQLVIGECILDSWLDLGVALVVGEARTCYLVVIFERLQLATSLEYCSLGGVLRSDPLYVIL